MAGNNSKQAAQRARKKVRKVVTEGIAHVHASFNNTIITITDSSASPAVTDGPFNFICGTKTKFFFNSLTAPISLINVLTSCIALEMGPVLDRILDEELSVSRFMSGEIPEESEHLK